MGDIFSSLKRYCSCCIGRDDDDDSTVSPYKPLTPTDDVLYDMRKLKYSTLDNYEYRIRVNYYVLMNGKRIDNI